MFEKVLWFIKLLSCLQSLVVIPLAAGEFVGKGFKVKLIQIEPHKRLSLQLHHHRSEHWIVVEGQAKITNGKRTWKVKTNESTFIPKNCLHRLENPTDKPLKIIEVQNRDYLEEDDIERLEDEYGRNNTNNARCITHNALRK